MAFFGMSLVALYQAESKNAIGSGDTKIDVYDYDPIVVLELFTSQGCSSCPPADVLLNKVKKEFPGEVYALSYHVDYWNYIGWKDPFSKSAFTKKQSGYNRKFRNRSNYTPQMVVNGKEHFVGSNATKLYSKIGSYKDLRANNKIKIEEVKTTGNMITFDYSVSGELDGKQLRAVLVLDERTTLVKSGENGNRTLRNSNIVVAENYSLLSAKHGEASIAIPAMVGKNDELSLMLLIEAENSDITAAYKMSLH